MDQALEQKLIEALEALENGESVDRILARYPQDSDQMRLMLETAVQLSQLNLQPSLAAQSRSRQAFLSQAEALRQAPSQRAPLAYWRQLLLPLLSLALVLLVFGGALFISASSAVPGDPLYSVKRLSENVRLALTADPAAYARLAEGYRRERIEEILVLLASGREAQVAFEGLVESIEEEHWLIAGLMTGVDADTIITGVAEVGRWAHVVGQTQAGQLYALTITVLPGNDEPAPTPTITATRQLSASPTAISTTSPPLSPTSTREPTATPEPSPTATTTNTPTLTASPPATSTPEPAATFQPAPTNPPAPTATPVSNNNDNDNDNDNDNSNDNDNGNGDNSNDDNGNDNDNDNDNSNDNSNDNDNDNGGGGNSNDDSGNDNDNDVDD